MKEAVGQTDLGELAVGEEGQQGLLVLVHLLHVPHHRPDALLHLLLQLIVATGKGNKQSKIIAD